MRGLAEESLWYLCRIALPGSNRSDLFCSLSLISEVSDRVVRLFAFVMNEAFVFDVNSVAVNVRRRHVIPSAQILTLVRIPLPHLGPSASIITMATSAWQRSTPSHYSRATTLPIGYHLARASPTNHISPYSALLASPKLPIRQALMHPPRLQSSLPSTKPSRKNKSGNPLKKKTPPKRPDASQYHVSATRAPPVPCAHPFRTPPAASVSPYVLCTLPIPGSLHAGEPPSHRAPATLRSLPARFQKPARCSAIVPVTPPNGRLPPTPLLRGPTSSSGNCGTATVCRYAVRSRRARLYVGGGT